MKRSIAFSLILAMLFVGMPCAVAGADDTTIGEDLFITGDDIYVDEPITGDVYAIGNSIRINAPISGDVIATGGDIEINAAVSGKVLLIGRNIDINANVHKAIMVGMDININECCKVATNAVIFGDNVTNSGIVKGELRVVADDFDNHGTYGRLELNENPIDWKFPLGVTWGYAILGLIMFVVHIMVTIGLILLGLLLLRFFKKGFLAIDTEIHRSPIIVVVLGFVALMASAILTIFLAVSVIGLPFAFLLGAISVAALIVSFLAASFTLGKLLAARFDWKTGDNWLFVIGLVLLRVLCWLPIIGIFFLLVILCFGYGAIFFAIRNNWSSLTSTGM